MERLEMIAALDAASDRYGNPHVTGVIDTYAALGLRDISDEEMLEYIRREGLFHSLPRAGEPA